MFSPDGTLISASAAPHCGADAAARQQTAEKAIKKCAVSGHMVQKKPTGGWGCSSVGRASDRHAVDAGWIPRVNFLCRLSYGVRTPPCAIACIRICAHVKDPVINVRVWWVVGKKPKHPACTVGWVALLCRSWLSLGRATRISHERHPIGTIQLLKKKKMQALTISTIPPNIARLW